MNESIDDVSARRCLMERPTTSIENRGDVINHWSKIDKSILVYLIDQMADDMRDLIEANRRYAFEKYGNDRVVEDYYCVKKMRDRLKILKYEVKDTGGVDC